MVAPDTEISSQTVCYIMNRACSFLCFAYVLYLLSTPFSTSRFNNLTHTVTAVRGALPLIIASVSPVRYSWQMIDSF